MHLYLVEVRNFSQAKTFRGYFFPAFSDVLATGGH